MDLDFVATTVASALDDGRDSLLEPEALTLLERCGFVVPARQVIDGATDIADIDLASLPGDALVVKVVAPDIVHKSDVGGVTVVRKEADRAAAAIESMASTLRAHDVRGFLIMERIDHERDLGSELLLSARWTSDFGPVVTLGAGGVYTELLTANMRPGQDIAIAAAALLDEAQVGDMAGNLFLSSALRGELRGQPARLAPGELERAVLDMADLARRAMPHLLTEVEINPLVAVGGRLVALDALIRCGTEVPPSPPRPRPLRKLANLLTPRSIALVGVSEGMNPGRAILQNVLRAGYPSDRVYIVKPDCETIDGCRCYPDIGSLTEAVDLLVIAVSADRVPDLLAAVIEAEKAESIILVPGGFEEKSGREGLTARIEKILSGSRSSAWGGPLVNGGNSMGIRSRPGGYDTSFLPHRKLPLGRRPHPLALISQSGAFYAARLSRLGVDPRYAISLGNQMDLTIGDYMAYLAADDEVEVFAVYVEGFRPGDGLRFVDAARALTARGKTVLLYRAGRTSAGARASASHTAALAGDYAVTRALAQRAGAVVCETLADLDDLLKLFVMLGDRPPRGRRLGALSNAGFESVAIADNVTGFTLADFREGTRSRLQGLLARLGLNAIVDVANPLDITPMAGDAAYAEALHTILADETVDAVVAGCVPLTPELQTLPESADHDESMTGMDAVGNLLISLWHETRKPWVVAVDAGPAYRPFAELLEAEGVPTFSSVDRAVSMLDRFCEVRLRQL